MLESARRIVIKIGSSLVAESSGSVHARWMATLAEDVQALMREKKQVILVTSGSVALGRNVMGLRDRPKELSEKQAAAACGQPLLMAAWAKAFAPFDLHVAQVLLTAEDSDSRKRYINARNTLSALLSARVIPVVNENDTVATAELRVGDNDRLAARVAQMSNADLLVLLSDIDGLYTADPGKDPKARHIAEVRSITPEIRAMAGGARSHVGSGGMRTKIDAAEIAMGAGCHMIICKGGDMHPLKALRDGALFTRFIATRQDISARKHWIVGSLAPMGRVVVDAGAAKALAGGKSLLPAGVKAVHGRFSAGDAVVIEDMDGITLGKGLAAYDSDAAKRIMGVKSDDIAKILGQKGRGVLIHRDDMALNS